MKQFTCIFDTIPCPQTVVNDLGKWGKAGKRREKAGTTGQLAGLLSGFPSGATPLVVG